MGRYYSGSIEGKFWFGVQPSDDPAFFGFQEQDQQEIHYLLTRDNLGLVSQGIDICRERLGVCEKKLDKFFDGSASYSDKQIATKFKISEDKVEKLLQWYARLQFGLKAKRFFDENPDEDYCEVDAEL